MIINILLIDNNQENLVRVQNFISELGIENCSIAQDYSQALKAISCTDPDLIICNPRILKKELRQSFFNKIRHLAIPLLWIVSDTHTCKKNILLQYNQN